MDALELYRQEDWRVRNQFAYRRAQNLLARNVKFLMGIENGLVWVCFIRTSESENVCR